MNYNTLRNKPTINHKELIGNNKASDIGGMTEEDMQELLETDLTPYYSKDEIDDLFARSFVYREKSGHIVTFDCPSTSQSIPKVTVGIEPVQSGSGDPSPTNVRPISGWSAVNVYDGPTTDPQAATVYTVDLDGTRYGGTLDVVSGVLTVDRVYIDMGTINWVYSENAQVFGSNQFTPYVITNGKLQSSQYKWNSTPNVSPMNLADCEMSASPYFNIHTVMVKDSRYSDATAFKTAMSGVQLIYELATPQTIQLTPTAVNSLLGTNNLWADTGDIEVKCLDRIIPAGE